MRKVIEARDTLVEIADFFHAVAHQENVVISRGMAISELARTANARAPRSLGNAKVLSTSAEPLRPRSGQPLLTVTYEQRRRVGAIAFKKCVDVGTTSGPVTGSVKVCIDCSIRKLKCTITIVVKGTITIG